MLLAGGSQRLTRGDQNWTECAVQHRTRYIDTNTFVSRTRVRSNRLEEDEGLKTDNNDRKVEKTITITLWKRAKLYRVTMAGFL